MQVKDLTIDQFKALIQEVVEDTLQDLLLDPDIGKTLRPNVCDRLTQIRQQRTTGQLVVHSLAEVEARLDLHEQ
ncbi:hypothetical protein [Nodosilinea sp. P-1105]|uniref:hypothetical protein n=1 Tax=Nodosilinea sp. P-1105 TaxID=2546229 RepID=UPI00146B0440|nr:hypothetical protein [Nodosilinea sp. P-1105]NMF84793.1 hypothetical protein [Nodosilinea sp. P-1105]